MARLLFSFAVSMALCVPLLAQEAIQAGKEVLGYLSIGKGGEGANYSSELDGVYGPTGPFIDSDGNLHFFDSMGYSREFLFSGGSFSTRKITEGWLKKNRVAQLTFVNQQGLLFSGSGIYRYIGGKIINYDTRSYINANTQQEMGANALYPLKNGFLFDFALAGKCFSFEFSTDATMKMRDPEETRKWLQTKVSDFSIGDDGAVLWNNVKYSVNSKQVYAYGKYRGRIKSGHAIFSYNSFGYDSVFNIMNPDGKTEIIMTLPWANDGSGNPFREYVYGIGPWGEIYCLIAPSYKDGETWPQPGSKAELVLIRSHLKYFGRTNAEKVRMRTGPVASADIIAELPKKAGFRILEWNGKKETIDGKTSDWVKVRCLDGREGWIFGAFIDNLYDGPGTPPPWPNIPD